MKWPAAIGGVPGKSVGYAAVCLGVILLCVVAGIWPAHRYAVRMRSEAARLKSEIAEQESLKPVYLSLNRTLLLDVPLSLAPPSPGRLPQTAIPDIPTLFSSVAQESGVESLLTLPQVQSMAGGEGLLLVDSAFSGDLEGFRKLLLKLGSMPYVRRVEELSLAKTVQRKELKLKVWLAIDVGAR